MGDLGDVLEAINRVDGTFANVRATVRQWSNPAVQRRADGSGLRIGVLKLVAEPPIPVSKEAMFRVWAALPTKVRIEECRTIKGRDGVALRIVDGDEWVERDWEGHLRMGRGDVEKPFALTDVDRHFDADLIRQIFSQLILEAKGRVDVAGRECIRIRGIPRAGCILWPHWIPMGADEYEFHADSERGALLAIRSSLGGEVFDIKEVVGVEFDQALDPGLFSYEPSAGEQVRPAVPVVEHLTLTKAIERVSFTILTLGNIPEAEGIALGDVMHYPPGGLSEREHLSISCNEGKLHIYQAQTPESWIDDFEWETIEHAGVAIRISDPGPGDEKRIAIVFERFGTHVMMHSDLDRERLIRLATTLVPATQPP